MTRPTTGTATLDLDGRRHVRELAPLASARPRSAPVDPQTTEGLRALLARYPAEQLARTLGYSRTVLARALAGKPLRPETAAALRALVAQGKALDLNPAGASCAA